MASYLELLNLTREPFSNSPDPDAYCSTPTHEACLNHLEIAIRLKRGLNVVFGEVGTGKSTLCRCLLRSLSGQDDVDVFLLLDAGSDDAEGFVTQLCELIVGVRPPEGTSRRACIGMIQNRVFERALEQGANMVLFVDEGQKLGPATLEVLRELLNFETNTEKLLQIVIFGQPELETVINGIPNFKDRINESLYLRPLSLCESIRLVRHRLRLAGGRAAERLFSLGSLVALHRISRGRPRQLMRLGHQMLIALLVGNRRRVTRRMVLAQAARNGEGASLWSRWVAAVVLLAILGGIALLPQVREKALSFLQYMEVSRFFSNETVREAPSLDLLQPDFPAGQTGTPSLQTDTGSAGAMSSAAARTGALPDAPTSTGQDGGRIKKGGASSELQSPSVSDPGVPGVSAGKAVSQEGFPEDLGAFFMQPDDRLADVVRAVYGSSSTLGIVRERNPAYRDGSAFVLQLPAVVSPAPRQFTKGLILSLGEYTGAEEAYRALQSYGKRKMSLELVPFWREGEGLRFHLLAPRSFATEQGAWSWVSRFSPSTSAQVRILPALDESCGVFHSFAAQ